MALMGIFLLVKNSFSELNSARSIPVKMNSLDSPSTVAAGRIEIHKSKFLVAVKSYNKQLKTKLPLPELVAGTYL